jgi:Na+-driven multidrug efflux pump
VIVAGGFPSSGLGWAWIATNIIGFCAVLVVAYRHNRTDYRDSNRRAVLWAITLGLVWPLTVVAWFIGRRRFTTPLSPQPHP